MGSPALGFGSQLRVYERALANLHFNGGMLRLPPKPELAIAVLVAVGWFLIDSIQKCFLRSGTPQEPTPKPAAPESGNALGLLPQAWGSVSGFLFWVLICCLAGSTP